MELRRYARVLRRWAWLLAACPLMAALAAAAVSLALPKVYEAQVSLLVRPSQPLAATDPGTVALTSDQISRTYARLMTEPPLLEKVSTDLGLHTSAEELKKQIKITPEANTTILDVTVSSTNPALARDVANTLVRDFVAQIKQIQQQEAQTPNSRSADNLVVVAPATTPSNPVSPRIPLNIALSALTALLIAAGLAFLLEYLDQSIKDDDEITARTGLVPIGHIGYLAAPASRRGELVSLLPDSPTAEAYRSLRTNLLFSTIDKEARTVVVTSPAPGEGKSRTVANLAVVLAQAGYRTLLIDADFRRPSQHRIFGRVRNLGLSNLMVAEGDEDHLVSAVEGVSNLWFLASGASPPNPSELLGSSRMRNLLQQLTSHFTYVVIDTPPVNAVTDATVLAAEADATLMVVEDRRTTYPALLHATQALRTVNARLLGVVVNKVKERDRAYYYDYSTGSAGRRDQGGGRVERPSNGTRANGRRGAAGVSSGITPPPK